MKTTSRGKIRFFYFCLFVANCTVAIGQDLGIISSGFPAFSLINAFILLSSRFVGAAADTTARRFVLTDQEIMKPSHDDPGLDLTSAAGQFLFRYIKDLRETKLRTASSEKNIAQYEKEKLGLVSDDLTKKILTIWLQKFAMQHTDAKKHEFLRSFNHTRLITTACLRIIAVDGYRLHTFWQFFPILLQYGALPNWDVLTEKPAHFLSALLEQHNFKAALLLIKHGAIPVLINTSEKVRESLQNYGKLVAESLSQDIVWTPNEQYDYFIVSANALPLHRSLLPAFIKSLDTGRLNVSALSAISKITWDQNVPCLDFRNDVKCSIDVKKVISDFSYFVNTVEDPLMRFSEFLAQYPASDHKLITALCAGRLMTRSSYPKEAAPSFLNKWILGSDIDINMVQYTQMSLLGFALKFSFYKVQYLLQAGAVIANKEITHLQQHISSVIGEESREIISFITLVLQCARDGKLLKKEEDCAEKYKKFNQTYGTRLNEHPSELEETITNSFKRS